MISVGLPDVSMTAYVPGFNMTDDDLTYTTKEQEKCTHVRFSTRKRHSLSAENIWLRQEKVTWKKPIPYLKGRRLTCKDFIIKETKLWEMPGAWQTKLFKRLMKMTWARDGNGKRPRAQWVLERREDALLIQRLHNTAENREVISCSDPSYRIQSRRNNTKDSEATNHSRRLPGSVNLLSGVRSPLVAKIWPSAPLSSNVAHLQGLPS